MKPHEQSFQTFDDILFENRNQAYGAYEIRRAYDSNVNRAASIVLGMAIVVTISSMVLPEDQIHVPTETPTIGCFFGEVTVVPDVVIQRKRPQSDHNRNLTPRPVSKPPEAAVLNVPIENIGDNTDTSTDLQMDGSEFGQGGESTVPSVPAIPEPPKIFDNVEVRPSYKGGMEAMAGFIKKHIKYPAIARRTETEGLVFVQFILSVDGRITEAKVIKGVSSECDKEALRVITMMPAWNAGLQGGIPVMVRMVLPIRFKLN